jgi:HSP20 family protein
MILEKQNRPNGEAVPGRGTLTAYRDMILRRLAQIREEIDRQWNDLTCALRLAEEDGWRWGLEIRDEDDAVVVRAEAPGFEPDDFDIQVSDSHLILRATRKVETWNRESRSHDYRQDECYESVTLPARIDKDRVEARYHNGILTITLPRTAEGKARHVSVKC